MPAPVLDESAPSSPPFLSSVLALEGSVLVTVAACLLPTAAFLTGLPRVVWLAVPPWFLWRAVPLWPCVGCTMPLPLGAVVGGAGTTGHMHMPSVAESLGLPVGVPAAPLHCPRQSCAVWQSWTQSLQQLTSISSFRGRDRYLFFWVSLQVDFCIFQCPCPHGASSSLPSFQQLA